jgi:hypothetical protein
MNSGQTLLTILAMTLFSLTVLTVHKNSLNNGTILRQTELGIYAVSLATSYIQKAKSMDFDEKTLSGLAITLPMTTPTASLLTATSSLGVDSTSTPIEVRNKDDTYDDFDDYKGFVKDTLISGADRFHVTADVYYVSMGSPYARVAGPTWLKQIDVNVNTSISRNVYENKQTSTVGTDTIKMHYIKSFYY